MTVNKAVLIIAVGVSLLTAQGPVVPPVPVKATQIFNITATTILDCSRTIFACIDNRNIQRQNNYHSYRAVGTGTWSVDMQFADTTATGFVSYGSTAQVSNAAPSSAIGYGIDPTSISGGRRYHDFIKFVITGNAQVVSYNGLKDVWSLPSAGAVSYPLQVNQGGTNSQTPFGWASNLQYQSSSAGGVPRTAQAKLGDIVNAADVGVVCDGTTDTTALLQQAIDGLASGKTLTFTGVTPCMISAGLQISGRSNISITSDNLAEIRYINGTPDVLYNTWPNFGKDSVFRILNSSNVRIAGLVINGNISNRTAFSGQESQNSGITISSGSGNITVENCILKENMTDGAVALFNSSTSTNVSNIFIRNNSIINNRRNNVSVTSCQHCRIGGNSLTGAGSIQGTAPKDGIDVEADGGSPDIIDDLLIEGNSATGNLDTGIRQFGQLVTNMRVSGNYVGNNTSFGISLENSSGQLSKNVSITGNQVANNGLTGIRIRKLSANLVANNTIFNNGVGIGLLEVAGLLITGNTVYGNIVDGIEVGSTGFAVNFASAAVIGNIIYDNASAQTITDGNGYAMHAYSSDVTSVLTFAGNTMYSTPGSATLMRGAFKGGVNYVTSNIGNGWSNINTSTGPVFSGLWSNQITNPWTFLDPAGATSVTVQAGTGQGASRLQTWAYSNGTPGVGFLLLDGGFLSENIYRVSDGAVMGQLSYAGSAASGFQNFGLNNVAGDYLSLNSTNGPVKISTGTGSITSIAVDLLHHTQIASAGSYANNAAAVGAGLPVGTIYVITGTDTAGIVH